MEKENKTSIEAPNSIAEMVKSGNAEFSHYKDGNLYYTFDVVSLKETYKYEFPIDITNKEDIGESSFERTYKRITLMRYIRKAIADGNLRWNKVV